jgi:hypothetical protein
MAQQGETGIFRFVQMPIALFGLWHRRMIALN